MALQTRFDSTTEELALGLCFFDSVLMAYTFWPADFTVEGATEPRLSLEQKLMVSDQSQKILFCTARKIAKSLIIECQILRKAMSEDIVPGQTVEGLITTPGAKQMELVHGRIMQKMRYDPLLSSLIAETSAGDNPQVRFRNGFVWKFRIEGLSGDDRNMIGIRAKHILGDEQQLSNWACHDSRKMTALPDCTFLYAGVPNGVRGTPFYALDQTSVGNTWSRHKYSSFVNPINQTDEGRQKIADDYGSEGSFSYQTLVLGQWGSETISSFPPGTVAVKPSAHVLIKELRGDQVIPYEENLGLVLQLPAIRCHSWVVGMDYGAVSDPSIMMFAMRPTGDSPWTQAIKITLNGVMIFLQAKIVKYIANHVLAGNFMGACTDSQALLDNLVQQFRDQSSLIFSANPGGMTVLLNEDGTVRMDLQGKPVKMRLKQYMHELLRKLFLNALMNFDGPKLWLGNDDSTVEELTATTERRTEGGYTVYYGPKHAGTANRAGGMDDHQRDALTYLARAIELGLMQDSEGYAESAVLDGLGWCGTNENWTAPWDPR